MPWSGGVYTRGYASWTADANSNLPISATKFDTEDNDFAAGLNNCATIDGLNMMQATFSPKVANSFGLGTAALPWAQLYLGAAGKPAIDTSTGNIGYFPTNGNETTAGITPTVFSYPPAFFDRYGLSVPANTAMGNGPPRLMGAQVGTQGTPSANAQPLISFTNYVSATTGIGNGYVGGCAWFETYVEGGTGFGVACTAYSQISGGTAISSVSSHAFAVISPSQSGQAAWAGWDQVYDQTTPVANQVLGREIDLVLWADRPRITGGHGTNMAVNLWLNNQSDEIGNFNGTAAIGITGEQNAGGLGFLSQYRTGIIIFQNAIVGGSGTHEAIQINGGNSPANRYTGLRMIGSFDVGLDLSGATFTGTDAAILLANGPQNGAIYALDSGAVGRAVFYVSVGNTLELGSGLANGVTLQGNCVAVGGFGCNGQAALGQLTGWGTPTNPGVVNNFSGTAATTAQIQTALAQVITTLKNFGLFGT